MLINCLHTVKWLQVLVFNINYCIQHYSFICSQLNCFKYCYVMPIIQFRHTVKVFQLLLFNINSSIQHYSFVCMHLICFKYCYVSLKIHLNTSDLFTHNRIIKLLFITMQLSGSHLFAQSLTLRFDPLTGATTPCQCGPGSNGNEEVLHVSQISKTEASPSDCLVLYPGHSLVGVIQLLQR